MEIDWGLKPKAKIYVIRGDKTWCVEVVEGKTTIDRRDFWVEDNDNAAFANAMAFANGYERGLQAGGWKAKIAIGSIPPEEFKKDIVERPAQ